MSERVVRFIATAADAPPPEAGVELVVLDTAWTPPPGMRADLRPLRPLVLAVLRERDPMAEAMHRLDAWAAASEVVARLEVDGWSWWWRRRLVAWRGLHDRVVWCWVLGALAAEGPIGRIELMTEAPELRDVLELAAPITGAVIVAPGASTATTAAPAPRRSLPWPIEPILRRIGRHRPQRGPHADRRRTWSERSEAMLARLRALGGDPGRLLVLTTPAVHQSLAGGGTVSVGDPFLGPIVERLRGTPLEPVLLEIGTDASDDRVWQRLHEPGRERVLPGSIVARSLADRSDDAPAEAARRTVAARLEAPFPPLDVDGVNLGPWVVDGLRTYVVSGLASDLRQTARIGRLLAMLRPAGLLMINEYSHPEWLIASARAGVPVLAVQHGIIHPLHAGYILPSRDRVPLATRTHLFGAYEARLLTKASVYRPDEVAVTGAPRLDLVPPGSGGVDEREALRASLGVGPKGRIVVFSSTSSASIRGTTFAAALDTLLDGPWPGVHLVVKLHPAEADGSFYESLVRGLARARGFEPPPLTVVKSVDLYQLLRAADAHLGVSSTVLTDAVAAGVRNLIVTSLHGTDLIGYVAAGVARPVCSAADLVAQLDRVEDPDPADRARKAFLADHFAPGPSGPRIADDLLARYSPGHLGLRPATMADADLLLAWANDPVTRATAFHPATIGRSEHLAWLDARLASPSSRLFIGLEAAAPVGQLRLDRLDDGAVEVSISVAPEARGRGVARRLLAAGITAGREAPGTTTQSFIARVRPDNAASFALFRGAGFIEVARDDVAGVPCVVLRLG